MKGAGALAFTSVAERGPIRATAGSEDIPLSGRERAEGFNICGAVAVAVAVSSSGERAEGFPICGAVAGAVTAAVTASSHSERAEGFTEGQHRHPSTPFPNAF
jgi:hypothetical protein